MSKLKPATLSSLVYFEACGRLMSFSNAARELCVTTAAVSQQIRKLEEQLGFKLFERLPSGICLTTDGVELLSVCKQSMEAIERTVDHLQKINSTQSLRLKSTPSFIFKWLIPRLKEFNQSFPDIQVETFADAALLTLDPAEFDLAIDYSTGKYQAFDSTLLIKEYLIPVASPDLAKNIIWEEPNSWSNLLLHDAIPWPDSTKDAEWRYWFNSAGYEKVDSKQGHFFNRSDMAIAAAAAGLGIAIARASLVQEELTSGQLLAPLPSVPSCCDYYLLTAKNSTSPSKATLLKDWLLSTCHTNSHQT